MRVGVHFAVRVAAYFVDHGSTQQVSAAARFHLHVREVPVPGRREERHHVSCGTHDGEEEYHEPEGGFYQSCLQLNYPGKEVDFTRIVEYKHKPNQPKDSKLQKSTVIFKEYSCDEGEPYYPVPNPKNRELYEKYKEMAAREDRVCFVGRLASYKYFNMDQAFLNALEIFDEYFSDSSSFRTTLIGEGDGPK